VATDIHSRGHGLGKESPGGPHAPGGGGTNGRGPGGTWRTASPVLRKVLLENGALSGLAVLVVALAVMSPDFLGTQNLLNVGVQAAVTAILAFGVTFVVVAGGIDLSVGSVAALSAIMLGYTSTKEGLPVWLSVLLAVGTGVACGLVSGGLIAYGKLPPFIATLAMLSVGRGLSLVLSDGTPIALPASVATVGETLGGWFPVPLLVLLAMGGITALVLARTYSGRVAGIVLASRLASAQPQAATGYELDAIAAVVIGGASLAGGVGKASGTLVGALILAVLRNGLNLLEVSVFWQQVVIGAVIALAVLLDTLRRRA
jgi:ribose/xylose/arabinose/galactoside ABC-type transport system permease subunit